VAVKHDAHGGHGRAKREPGPMMAREHYAPYRWVQAPVALLGLWLATSPFSLGYTDAASTWNDVVTGLVVCVLAVLALVRRLGAWPSWANAVTGSWLLFAPLVFWAPDAAAYANDTLAGAMLIAFAFLIPMGMEMEGADVPPGWSYNPSSWPQRAPIIALGFIGFFAARYMAAYQLGYVDRAWDPFFPEGTERVLDSDVSKMWPISDAGLGAATYLIECLSGFMGDKRRWRTMPWMVAIFGFAVVPLGVVSIVLIILQPLMVGTWCTLCLISAAAMLLMIPLSLDEVVAMLQFLARRRREGASLWRAFWRGGNLDDSETVTPARAITWAPRGMSRGVSHSVSLYASVALGVWLMFAPSVLGTTGGAADSDHLVGALVIVVATIALAEVARPVRWLNAAFGVWLVAGPWFLDGGSFATRLLDLVAGLALIVLSVPLGRLRDHYGTIDRWVAGGTVLAADRARARAWREDAHRAPEPRVIVITGASAGVGRALVRHMAGPGVKLALLARKRSRLEAAADEARERGAEALVIPLDVADPDAVERAAARIERELGPIDVWINDAMASVFAPAAQMTPEEYRRVTDVTYLGYVWGTLAALRHMRTRNRGTIVQVGSALAHRSIPLQSAYCAAKHAVKGFTESIRTELIHDGSAVHITTVELPAVNTPQFDWVRSRLPRRAQPVGPVYQPEVAAEAIAWAAEHRRRSTWLGFSTVKAIVGNRVIPWALDRLLAGKGWDGQMTPEPAPEDQPGNLFDPPPGDPGAHGRFDARARTASAQFWLSRHRAAIACGLLTLAVAAATLLI
jgi:NADP-dependent 3-hydroxy acid dehydrogenase YdfG